MITTQRLILLTLIYTTSCTKNCTNDIVDNNKLTLCMNEGIKITSIKNNTSYNNRITIYFKNEAIYCDTSATEYIFNNSSPTLEKLSKNQHELLIKYFDAPDLNKTLLIHFNKGLVTHIDTLPDIIPLKDQPNTYSGVLHIVDSPNSQDSCYYNPTLYYKKTSAGIKLDTPLTVINNTKKWGVFLGFHSNNKVLPCPSN